MKSRHERERQAIRDHVQFSLVEAGLAEAFLVIREKDEAELWSMVVPHGGDVNTQDLVMDALVRFREVARNREAIGWGGFTESPVKMVTMSEKEARKRVGYAEEALMRTDYSMNSGEYLEARAALWNDVPELREIKETKRAEAIVFWEKERNEEGTSKLVDAILEQLYDAF